MSTLLKITASIAGQAASSSQLADRYAADWLARHPVSRVVTRDLSSDPVPHIDAARFGAFLAAPSQRTPEQQAVVDYSDALIAELREAAAASLEEQRAVEARDSLPFGEFVARYTAGSLV